MQQTQKDKTADLAQRVAFCSTNRSSASSFFPLLASSSSRALSLSFASGSHLGQYSHDLIERSVIPSFCSDLWFLRCLLSLQ